MTACLGIGEYSNSISIDGDGRVNPYAMHDILGIPIDSPSFAVLSLQRMLGTANDPYSSIETNRSASFAPESSQLSRSPRRRVSSTRPSSESEGRK